MLFKESVLSRGFIFGKDLKSTQFQQLILKIRKLMYKDTFGTQVHAADRGEGLGLPGHS